MGWVAERVGWQHRWAQLLAAALAHLRGEATPADEMPDRHMPRILLVATLLLEEAKAQSGLVDLDRSDACLEEADVLLEDSISNDDRWVEAHFWLRRQKAWNLQDRGEFAASLGLFQANLSELDEDRYDLWPYTPELQSYWQAELCGGLSYSTLALGRWDEARRWVEQSAELYEQSGSEIGRAHAMRQLAAGLLSHRLLRGG